METKYYVEDFLLTVELGGIGCSGYYCVLHRKTKDDFGSQYYEVVLEVGEGDASYKILEKFHHKFLTSDDIRIIRGGSGSRKIYVEDFDSEGNIYFVNITEKCEPVILDLLEAIQAGVVKVK